MANSGMFSFSIEKRGYNIEEVDNYVEDLLAKIKYLQAEKNELEQKLDSAKRMIRKFTGEENNLRQSIADSKRAAAAMMKDTQSRSEMLLDKTRESCGDIITELDSNIESRLKVVDEIKTAVTDFKNELFRMYSDHIGLIENIADAANDFTFVPDYSVISDAVDEFEANDTTSYTPTEFPEYPQKSIFEDAKQFEAGDGFDMTNEEPQAAVGTPESSDTYTISDDESEEQTVKAPEEIKLPAFETDNIGEDADRKTDLDEDSFRFLSTFANEDDDYSADDNDDDDENKDN